MTAAAVLMQDVPSAWGRNTPHVRKALAFIRKRGHVTADELVEWDRTHGRLLFDWDNPRAAEEWRKQQARTFLNSFRTVFDKMRVRGFIKIRENEAAGIDEEGYYTVEAIADHPGMRAQVLADVTKRMASMASELRMWKLSPQEQGALFIRIAEAIGAKSEAA